MMALRTALFLLGISLSAASRMSFLLNPRMSECVYETTSAPNSLLYVSLVVASGGDLDVSVNVHDPNNEIVFSERYATATRFVIRAIEVGEYSLCVGNDATFHHEKQVILHFETQDDLNRRYRPHGSIAVGGPGTEPSTMSSGDPIRRSLMRINEAVQFLIDELTVSRAVHYRHARDAQGMVTYVDACGAGLSVLVVVLAAVQYYFLKKRILRGTTRSRA